MPTAYLDSCILIYRFEATPDVRAAIQAALAPMTGEAPVLHVSALTRLECRVGPLRSADSTLITTYDGFFESRDLRRCRLTRAVFDLATEYRARDGLKTPGALHLAAAVIHRCDELWTNDTRLKNAARNALRIRVLP